MDLQDGGEGRLGSSSPKPEALSAKSCKHLESFLSFLLNTLFPTSTACPSTEVKSVRVRLPRPSPRLTLPTLPPQPSVLKGLACPLPLRGTTAIRGSTYSAHTLFHWLLSPTQFGAGCGERAPSVHGPCRQPSCTWTECTSRATTAGSDCAGRCCTGALGSPCLIPEVSGQGSASSARILHLESSFLYFCWGLAFLGRGPTAHPDLGGCRSS